ncbi:MAG: class II fructose-bisphosphatase [Hyphomicrobiales bacterium]
MTKIPDELTGEVSLGLVRASEAAAIAASRMRGRGLEMDADRLAVDAMRNALNRLDIDGVVVIGEGERDKAPMLYIGESVGTGRGPKVDIALDPLEGTRLTAKAMANALTVIAMAPAGNLLHAPDLYMEKIAIGGGYEPGVIDLDLPPGDNVQRLARAKGVVVSEITACILDRPRHAKTIAALRAAGVAIHLITDGDIAGVIHTADPGSTGIDIYMGVGGAPEGVLAAAALRCIGGQMQGRLVIDNEEQRKRSEAMGLKDVNRKFSAEEMAAGDVLFAATGVTDGSLLSGVRREAEGFVTTHSVIMCARTETIRWIRGRHKTEKLA